MNYLILNQPLPYPSILELMTARCRLYISQPKFQQRMKNMKNINREVQKASENLLPMSEKFKIPKEGNVEQIRQSKETMDELDQFIREQKQTPPESTH